MADMTTSAMNSPVVGKVEDSLGGGDRSSSSLASTPELEELHDHDHDHDIPHNPEQQQQQQKRKGGRKPIYATSEERKQRNRQAQAAFRERRTEYIKQLEGTIKVHEDTLQTLQQSHRRAADECLMLRYKNSLLERILLEKGIDVQAELRQKGGSPNLGPARVTGSTPGSQPIQRFAVNKFAAHNRRSLSSLPTKQDGAIQIQAANISPHLQPTPTSRLSSPTSPPAASVTRLPNYLPQLSPSFGPSAQQPQQLRPRQPLRPHFGASPRPAVASTAYPSNVPTISDGNAMNAAGRVAAGASVPNYYPSPFQTHYDELEQEYDAQADMLDDTDPADTQPGVATFPPPFPTGSMPQHGMPQQRQLPPPLPMTHQALRPQPSPVPAPDGSGGFNQLFDPYDPMLDADPFGLSASMHFPTQFQFDAPAR